MDKSTVEFAVRLKHPGALFVSSELCEPLSYLYLSLACDVNFFFVKGCKTTNHPCSTSFLTIIDTEFVGCGIQNPCACQKEIVFLRNVTYYFGDELVFFTIRVCEQ
jgi:hypothetical protein